MRANGCYYHGSHRGNNDRTSCCQGISSRPGRRGYDQPVCFVIGNDMIIGLQFINQHPMGLASIDDHIIQSKKCTGLPSIVHCAFENYSWLNEIISCNYLIQFFKHLIHIHCCKETQLTQMNPQDRNISIPYSACKGKHGPVPT